MEITFYLTPSRLTRRVKICANASQWGDKADWVVSVSVRVPKMNIIPSTQVKISWFRTAVDSNVSKN
jgi:hypothetical protein